MARMLQWLWSSQSIQRPKRSERTAETSSRSRCKKRPIAHLSIDVLCCWVKNCEDLVSEVKKEYDLERSVTAPKLREVAGKTPRETARRGWMVVFIADAFGSVYRSDEINNLSDELMAELGRDEKILEKIGSQDLPPNEVMMFSFSIVLRLSRSLF